MTASGPQPKLTIDFVSKALGLAWPASAAAELPFTFSKIVTDSRKVQPGCLFVCLKGEKFDAHDFIPEVIRGGAAGILCRKNTRVDHPQGKAHFFYIDDTLQAFRQLAYHWRRGFNIPVIAVAGSVGKTTTKELLTAILGGKFNSVLKTQGSQNGYVGIPMTLLELKPEHQAAVIEVGIDEIGAMKEHMNLVGATASVLTTIGPEHLEKLQNIQTVAQEEGLALTLVAQNGGRVAINLDDPWIAPHAQAILQGQKMTYSLSDSKAQLRGQYSAKDNTLTVTTAFGKSSAHYDLPLLGIHNARNTLAAISVAVGLGLRHSDIQEGLRDFKTAGGRSEVRTLAKIQWVCDYYNANPTSTEAGLELLVQIAQVSQAPNRVACLGDMLELGTEEEHFHRELATPLLKHKIEHVYLYGPRMKWLAEELKKRRYTGKLQHFEDHGLLSDTVARTVHPGDVVLIKGSRGMRMEEVFKKLEQCLPKS